MRRSEFTVFLAASQRLPEKSGTSAAGLSAARGRQTGALQASNNLSERSAMDLRRLDVFCRVVELKSFTKAAVAMGLAQPTVSEHIRSIEDMLGEKLVDRLGREVVPGVDPSVDDAS